MSKLNFKESGYYDSVDGSENEQDYEDTMQFNAESDEDVVDAYALYNVDPSMSSRSSSSSLYEKEKKMSKKDKKRKMDADSDSDVVAVVAPIEGIADEPEEPQSSKKKKKRKKRKLNATQSEEAVSDTPIDKPTIQSDFLAKFLSRKRDASEVPEPPEIELPNDSFLRLFQDSFKTHRSGKLKGADETASENDEESDQEYVTEFKKNNIRLSGAHRNDSNSSFYASTEGGDEEVVPIDAPVGPITVALQLFNLPYRISTEQLQKFGKRHGCNITSVTMGVDWKTKLPSGSATVQVELPGTSSDHPGGGDGGEDEPNLYGDPEHDEVADCIARMQGEDCGGRPLRVQRFLVKKRQSGSLGGRGDSRYFSGDISCKCHSCGQVGHRQQECTNDAVPNPCHLCAGQDHDAGSCPNITCYRCGKFGHHSRDCTFASMAKPVICTNCGSTTHDARQCRDTGSAYQAHVIASDSKVAGPLVRCMSCNQYGHVLCQALPPVPVATAGEIYCPNCGEQGHHIDFPLLCSPSAGGAGSGGESAKKKSRHNKSASAGSSLCTEPKYEAFMKYPQLFREVDGVSDFERLDYYRDLTRRSSYSDQMLFPPLARQLASFNTSAQGGGPRGAPAARHSIGGGGDTGRSVVVKYQETRPERSQSVGPRVQQQHQHQQQHQQQGRSALFDNTTGRRKSLEPELASRYASLHGDTWGNNDGSGSNSNNQHHQYNNNNNSSSKKNESFGNNRNDRRDSLPLNSAPRGRPSDPPSSHRFFSPEAKPPQNGSAGKQRPPPPRTPAPPPPPPPLRLPPMQASNASWKETIESRKRRFNQ